MSFKFYMKKALILVDLLKDFFPGGRLACNRAPMIVENIKGLISKFREHSALVVYVNDSHLPKVDQEFQIWGSHAVRGEPGSEIIDDLNIEKTDFVIRKRRYSAFSGTDLHYLLLEHGIKSLVLCGLHTHVCIRHTAYDAFLNGYSIEVAEDSVEAFSKEEHESGLKYLKMVYGAKLLKSKEISVH